MNHCENEGDALSVFGLSRGAHTARTLVALLNWGGTLSGLHFLLARRITDVYLSRRPDKPWSIINASQTYHRLTKLWPSRSAEDAEVRLMLAATTMKGKKLPKKVMAWIAEAPQRDEQGRAQPVRVCVCGTWDTVGVYLAPSNRQRNVAIQRSSMMCCLLTYSMRFRPFRCSKIERASPWLAGCSLQKE